jgi:prephenate dehydratase
MRRGQNKIKLAFQGEPGAYSEEAAFKYFGEDIKTIGYETLEEVFVVTEKKKVDFGIVPVENSIEGTVRKVMNCF